MTAGNGSPIRVAAILDTASVSGPGRQLADLAARLPETGVHLHVVTFRRDTDGSQSRSPYLDYLDRAGVTYTVIRERHAFDPKLIAGLDAALSQCRPHVVQTHGYKPTVLAFALRRSGARWPWVAFCHGATAENRKIALYNWLERRLIAGADRVVVMSGEQKQRLSKLRERVRVIHNASIPLPAEHDDATSPTDARFAQLPLDRPLIGVVGRLSPEKGVDVFLEACAELARRGVRFDAVVAGEGPERSRLEQSRAALALDNVRFIGGVSAVQTLYRKLDLLVIPSRSEGLPNVLLEALRADVPVVATRVGAVPEVLDGSAAGVICPPASPMDLANAIVTGLRLKNDAVSRVARHAVSERFSPAQRTRAHVELYQELLR